MVPPDTFQHYQILRRDDGRLWELGRGSMGVMYKAFDTNLQCLVALKVITGALLHDETARTRFVREARAAAALRHRNVASVYHLCGDGDHFFYAMEFIDGETVDTWVRRAGRLPVSTALEVALQTTRALGAAARQRLVHRDVKPANLMVVHEDQDEHFLVKLIDFGLARPVRTGDTTAGAANSSGAGFHGTPAFASPEQLNEVELDARSDIYSLGVALWFMLTGEPPFTGNLAVLYRQHLHQPPPWERLAGTPEPVVSLLRLMLEKDPDRRPQSASELRERLAECARAVLALTPGAAAAGADQGWVDLPTASPDAGAEPSEPAPGLMLANGLRLGPLVGEGNHGQVFRANDPRRDHRPLAVKVFHPETLNDARFESLRRRIHRLQSAPHPNLLTVHTLGRSRHFTYAMLEWVEGFTLTGLLGKRGTLTVTECLRLLQQAAAAADHACAHGLTGLELAPHQVLVHFSGGLGSGGGREALLRDPLMTWPEFILKLDALDGALGGGEMAADDGEINPALDPTGRVPAGAKRSDRTLPNRAGPDLRGLGLLVYELLGGTGVPPLLRTGQAVAVVGGSGGEINPLPLPILNALGNEVLRDCLSGTSDFQSGAEFFHALARAAGCDPDSLRPARPEPAAETPAANPPLAYPVEVKTRAPARGVETVWGTPSRRRWTVALAGLALGLALASLSWWALVEPGAISPAEPPAHTTQMETRPTTPESSAPPVEPTPEPTVAPAEQPAPAPTPLVVTPPAQEAPSEAGPEMPTEGTAEAAVDPTVRPNAADGRSEAAAPAGPAPPPRVAEIRQPQRAAAGERLRATGRSRNQGGAPFEAVESPGADRKSSRTSQREQPRDWPAISRAESRARRRRRFDPDFLERVYGVRPPARAQPPEGRTSKGENL